MPEVLALIPARGGSKSLPRKNVLPLAGIPLIARTILAAGQAKMIGRVAVTTDDEEIAQIARRFGADVIERPAEFATDQASSESALLHALDHLKETEDYRPDILCFLQCTSPLTTAEDIDGVLEALVRQQADTALAVTRFHYFVWRNDERGDAIGVNHDKQVRLRRQDRHSEFLETGSVYAMRSEGFRAAQHRFFGKTALFEIPANRVLEIDDPKDFELAAERLSARSAIDQALPSPVQGVVFDFDGVMTDDRVLVDQEGKEAVFCSRGDGMGIELLREAGMPMIVISKEKNPVVARRCQKLQLDYHQGENSKIGRLRVWAEERSLDLEKVIYVGNDINDLECMAAVGCAVVPADAHPTARRAAKIVLKAAGGRGAVRELADMILNGADNYSEVTVAGGAHALRGDASAGPLLNSAH